MSHLGEMLVLVLLLVQQPGRPGRPVLLLPSHTVSSGEEASVAWTVAPTQTGLVYDVSLDGGPWRPAVTVDVPPDWWLPPGGDRILATTLGLLSVGAHSVLVRECSADRLSCAVSSPAAVTSVPPVPCEVSEWGSWSDWTAWVRSGAIETHTRTRTRTITTMPGIGASACPALMDTALESRPYVPPPLDPITVAYVRTDATTKGAWNGVYGAQGVLLAGAAAPAVVKVIPVDALLWTWATSTADPRGLQKPGSIDLTDRVAVGWYSATAFDLDVRFSDTAEHEVAIYAVDWDGLGRAQRIDILDTQGTVRHSVTTGPELQTGAYYVWRMSGHAVVRVTRTGLANGVVFALLFGS